MAREVARAETELTGSCEEKQASVNAVTRSGSAAIEAAQLLIEGSLSADGAKKFS